MSTLISTMAMIQPLSFFKFLLRHILRAVQDAHHNNTIGHKNNMLILGPGGYRFGDYWRMGLPLEIIVVAVAVPMILLVWPM